MADEETMTAEPPAPAPPQPETASPDVNAQIQPEQQQGIALPQQNAGPGRLTSVLQTLAGHPMQNAGFDPNTGTQTGTPVDSKTGLIATILMHGLAGAFRGMAAPPGPGHVAQGAAAGFQGGIQDQQRQREMMQQDFERQQQAQVQRLQVAHLNAQTALDSANAQHAGMESLNLGKEMNDEAVQQLTSSGAIETDASGNPVTLTQADILAKVQNGELNAGDSIGMQYGGTMGADGNPQALYVVNKDPNAPVKITQDQVDRWHSMGVDVPKEIVGQSIPAKSFSAYSNQALVSSTGTAVLNTLRHDAGDNKALLDKLPQSIDPQTPGMQTALRMMQQALRGSKGDVYGALEAVYQKNPQAGQTLIDAMGGRDTIRDISDAHAAAVKAQMRSDKGLEHVTLTGPNGKPIAAVFDPGTGKYTDAAGNPIENPQPYEKPTQTPGVTIMVPNGQGGYTVQRATEGQSVAPGAVTAQGMNSLNVPTSSTRTMVETAPRVIELADRAEQLIDPQVQTLGPASSRWAEFMAGKVGAPNADFTKLRTNIGLLSTALMRMHVGARGGEQIMQHFADLIDSSKQSPENLKAALEEIKQYANQVKGEVPNQPNQSQQQPKETTQAAPPPQRPSAVPPDYVWNPQGNGGKGSWDHPQLH